MSKVPELYRKDLIMGNLYYMQERFKRKSKSSYAFLNDNLTVWKIGPEISEQFSYKDTVVESIWLNCYNPFMVLEIKVDREISSTFWYKVLTLRGNIGWIVLDDEDIEFMRYCFRDAIIPPK